MLGKKCLRYFEIDNQVQEKNKKAYQYWTAEEDLALLRAAEAFDRKSWRKLCKFSRGNVSICYGRFKTLMRMEFGLDRKKEEIEMSQKDILIAYHYLFNDTSPDAVALLTGMHTDFISERIHSNILPKMAIYKEYFEKKVPENWIQKETVLKVTNFSLRTEMLEKLKVYMENNKLMQENLKLLASLVNYK